MPASTIGMPVRPSRHTPNASGSRRQLRVARPVVGVREIRTVGEHLAMEVAPAELACEVLARRAALAALEHGPRREAAEVQVGAEPRGRVPGEVVVVLVVVLEVTRGEAGQALAARRLAVRREAHATREETGAGRRIAGSPRGAAMRRGVVAAPGSGSARHARQ